jgi:hypothetical protein
MKTQETIDEQVISPERGRSKAASWLASLGAMLVVALVIGASVIVFAQLGQQHKSTSAIPPSGKWVQALNGYTLASLAAAPADATTLYACAVRAQADAVGTSSAPSYTILRSTDFGTHWRDVGSKAGLGANCQLTVNPGNSNELYAVAMLNGGTTQASSVLKHSLDGGQTWATIAPAFARPGANAVPTWNVEQLSMIGNTLFGVQWFPQTVHPGLRGGGILPKIYAGLTRLVKSSDGGRTWSVLEQQFSTPGQGVSDYAIDPTNANTIYELASVPWLPVQPREAEPNNQLPVYGSGGDLYKSSDGGATWQRLLQNLPIGSRLQLASGNPQLLYVGGSRPFLPYLQRVPVFDPPKVDTSGSFHLQVSSDGGASWRAVPGLPQASQSSKLSYIQSWSISPRGQVYAYSTGSPASMRRYDPASNSWAGVTAPPTTGVLLGVTPGDTNSDVLWFAGSNGGQSVLYRYVS